MGNKQQLAKGQLVYVKDTEHELWDMRYFSHKKDNLYYCFNNQEKIGSSKVWNYIEISNPLIEPAPTPEAPDNIPTAEEYCNQYLKDNWDSRYGSIDVVNILMPKALESYAQIRESNAVEVERNKCKQFIINRIDLIPNNDDLPLSQRGSLDAYINCLNYLKQLKNGK